ncbi:hypothetical protein BJY52DRAFT_1234005 [Lactarius psammicola]|nr:hypothetical protein BJY52DRAFT_1234005 [Lactarius psammicola]
MCTNGDAHQVLLVAWAVLVVLVGAVSFQGAENRECYKCFLGPVGSFKNPSLRIVNPKELGSHRSGRIRHQCPVVQHEERPTLSVQLASRDNVPFVVYVIRDIRANTSPQSSSQSVKAYVYHARNQWLIESILYSEYQYTSIQAQSLTKTNVGG